MKIMSIKDYEEILTDAGLYLGNLNAIIKTFLLSKTRRQPFNRLGKFPPYCIMKFKCFIAASLYRIYDFF